MIRLANWLSIALHPMAMLVVGLAIALSHSGVSSAGAYGWAIFALLFVVIFSLYIVLGVNRQWFTDLDVSRQGQRAPMYTVAGALGGLYALGLFLLGAPRLLLQMSWLMLLLVGCLSWINGRIKASGHTASVAALATSVILLYGAPAVPLLLLVPIIAWSRVAVHRHTVTETLVGAGIGICSVLVVAGAYLYIMTL